MSIVNKKKTTQQILETHRIHTGKQTRGCEFNKQNIPSKMSESTANEAIIKNLENQLERLVQQSIDLEECK